MRKLIFDYAKTKAQISCAVTAQLISAFVFADRTVLIGQLPVPAKKDRQNSLSQKRSFLSLFVFIIV